MDKCVIVMGLLKNNLPISNIDVMGRGEREAGTGLPDFPLPTLHYPIRGGMLFLIGYPISWKSEI